MADKKEILDRRGKPRVSTVNTEPSLTVQSQADQADIQKILKKYKETGLVTSLNKTQGQFVDVSNFTDYADLMRNVKNAEAEFMKLPSKVREIFDHDVSKWLDAAHDPEKRDQLIEAGFIEAEPEADPPPKPAPGDGTPEAVPASSDPAEMP